MEEEYSVCDICGCQDKITRTYYYYNINCDCCNGKTHFEFVRTCPRCEPQPPKYITAQMKPQTCRDETSNITDFYSISKINPENWEYYD